MTTARVMFALFLVVSGSASPALATPPPHQPTAREPATVGGHHALAGARAPGLHAIGRRTTNGTGEFSRATTVLGQGDAVLQRYEGHDLSAQPELRAAVQSLREARTALFGTMHGMASPLPGAAQKETRNVERAIKQVNASIVLPHAATMLARSSALLDTFDGRDLSANPDFEAAVHTLRTSQESLFDTLHGAAKPNVDQAKVETRDLERVIDLVRHYASSPL